MDGDPQSVLYANGVIQCQWVHRKLRSADSVFRGRVPQSIPSSTKGSVGVIIDGDPLSVSYADGVIHSSQTGSAVGVANDGAIMQSDAFNPNRSTGLIQPDSFNRTRST